MNKQVPRSRFQWDGVGPETGGGNNWCSTPACAIGHFAFRTDLQQVMKIREVYIGDYRRTSEVVGSDDCTDWWKIAKEYFQLDGRECDELFNPEGCGGAKTIEQAVEYICEFWERKYGSELFS